MVIDIGAIKSTVGKSMRFSLQTEWPPMDGVPQFVAGHSPLELEVEATNTGHGYLLTGTGRGTAKLRCTRCLGHFLFPLEICFEQDYESSRDPHAEPKDCASDILYFSGDCIDLTELTYQSLALAIPYQLLCRPDCRGLCPTCGQLLNVSTCGCASEEVDPRLKVLEKLLREEES